MQLELFHPKPQRRQEHRIWEQLIQEQRSALITILLRLMKKAVLLPPKEDDHER